MPTGSERHYQFSQPISSSIELIEELDAGFNVGNAIKYLCRAGRKDPTKRDSDIQKALNYLHRELFGTWFGETGPVVTDQDIAEWFYTRGEAPRNDLTDRYCPACEDELNPASAFHGTQHTCLDVMG